MRATPATSWRLCSTALALGLLPAVASAGQPTVGVNYRAPADCPDSAEFIALLEARAPGSWRFREGTGDPLFVVEIRDAGGGMLGRLRRRTGDRTSETREVHARSCREVAQALALTATISLGPAGAPSEASPWIWSAGVGAAALTLLPPSPMFEARVHVETGAPARNGFHAPDLRLTLAHARNDVRWLGPARFTLSSIGLNACPLSWHLLRLCLGVEGGLLAATGRAVDRPRSIRRWWTAAGAVASVRWTMARWLIVESFGGVRVPFRRADFVFEMPRRPVATIPPAVLLGGVSFARTIP
jgi:hypothetical protein